MPPKNRNFSMFLVRGRRVILDVDLAALYGVTTSRLNEQLKRNVGRFPDDFAFRLSLREVQDLRSQIATSSQDWGGRRRPPYAFTEHGAVMAASVLRSPRAVQMSVLVVREFVRLRHALTTSSELRLRLQQLEGKLSTHDREIATLFAAIKELMAPPETARKIGFLPTND